MNAIKPHYKDAEKIKRLTAWHEADKKELAAQAATIAQLREALEQIASLGLTISESEYCRGYNKAIDMVQSFAARALKGGE